MPSTPAKSSSTINLGLPSVPEVSDLKLFPEFVRVYNALNLIASVLDTYTSDGTSVSSLSALDAAYHSYTVPNFSVTADLLVGGEFGCNGKPVQGPVTFVATPMAIPAGGLGTVAGAWDTAINRDNAIATINSLVAAVAEIKTALSNIGIAV